MTIAVIYATFAVAKRKREKKFSLVRDSNPSPRQNRCSDLPIKLTSQLGQLVELVNYKPVKGWWWSNEYIKIIYVNCGVKNYERWSSQLYTQLSQLRKDSLKKIDSGFEPLTSSSFHGLITNPFQRPAPSCTSIGEVKGSNPVQAWIFQGFFSQLQNLRI